MSKTLLILQREYLTRIKKKSFIILTLLMPLLFAGLIAFSVFMSMQDDKEEQSIAIYDATSLFLNELKETDFIKFEYIPESEYHHLKETNDLGSYTALIFIPQNLFAANRIQIFSKQHINAKTLSSIRRQIEQIVVNSKKDAIFKEIGIPNLEKRIAATKTSIQVDTFKLEEDGSSTKVLSHINSLIGFACGFIIYMMIILYGSMVMRGVIEEKTNRISEVLISSVKPMQLMFGKIIGIGLVGITQFLIWIIFGGAILSAGSYLFSGNDMQEVAQVSSSIMENQQELMKTNLEVNNEAFEEINEIINSINIPFLLSAFLFFFIFGYLLYASLMGAIGSAVSSDEDANQFVSVAIIPLVIAMILVSPVSSSPNSALAIWTSIIPLFSPIIMMVRIPAEVPLIQLLTSAIVLIASTIGTIWLAAKIYRTGILMYGKKISLKEITKWIRR